MRENRRRYEKKIDDDGANNKYLKLSILISCCHFSIRRTKKIGMLFTTFNTKIKDKLSSKLGKMT